MSTQRQVAGFDPASTPPDPGAVHTPEQFRQALNALAAGRGPTELEAAAHRLQPPASLSKQTVSDLLREGRPREATLATFLRVCQVPRQEHQAWQAARGRAEGHSREPDLRRLVPLIRVGDADPRNLGVHPAIEVPGAHRELPTYVERDTDTAPNGVRALIRRAVTGGRGQLLLLVGQSSTGKTRCAFEAIQQLLPDGWLLQPADVEQIRQAAAHPRADLVVWLDELQNYLGASDGLTPDLVRTLTRSGVLLIATMREEFYQKYAHQPGHEDSRAYAIAWEVLTKQATPIPIRAKLSTAEQTRAQAAAAHDGYLRAGLLFDAQEPFPAIAGAPVLTRRAEGGDPHIRAVLDAAVDATRLGVWSPLSDAFLREAALGYCDERQRGALSHDWYESALAYLTQPLIRTAAVLDPVAPPGTVGARGYRVAGYLLQEIGRARRFTKVPAATWHALIKHVTSPDDQVRAADTAMYLLLYDCAEKLLRRAHAAGGEVSKLLADLLARQGRIKDLRALAEAGDIAAGERLVLLLVLRGRLSEAKAVCLCLGRGMFPHAWLIADALTEQGRIEEAIAFHRALADAGDDSAVGQLAQLLAEQDRIDDLRDLAEDSHNDNDHHAAYHLTRPLAEQDRIDDLRHLAHDGMPYAAEELVDVLVKQGEADEAIAALRAIPETGRHPIVATMLADLLLERGEVDAAIAALRPLAATGHRSVIHRLLGLLLQRAPLEELHALARAGGPATTRELAELLAQHDRMDDLRALAEAGDHLAAHQLAKLLAKQGRAEEAITIVAAQADAGHGYARTLLARQGRIDELRAMADEGNDDAACQLTLLLAEQGRLEDLRSLAEAGHSVAEDQLARLLAEQNRIDDLRMLAKAGHDQATRRLVDMLVEQGQIEELRTLAKAGHDSAIEALAEHGPIEDLRALVTADHHTAVRRLSQLLGRQGRTDDLHTLTEAGHYQAAEQLAALLAEQRRTEDLRALVDVGAPYAAQRLIALLCDRGQEEAAERIQRFGLPLEDDGEVQK
ncbi:hypothetical protein [Nonomuraea jabiensis]|uniref:hypothetical protein n=1 Tax=Nonomuraea jabiensis TaxID=882448 RepID=UPI003D728564